jgi:protein-L-isoaspartate(D-aspartate) O-methyltransferase
MSACMSEIMGPNTLTVGIDHIEDIVKFATENIQKKNSYLFENNRLKLIKADGRKGFKDYEPYDVIHVGGALANIPKELEDQLACGGRMWIPVGTQGRQSILLVDKDVNGKISSKKLLDVAYGLLTTVENQLQQNLF